MTNLMCVEKLREWADDPKFQTEFMEVKRKAKVSGRGTCIEGAPARERREEMS
jgi:hypothetical protein